ncbi:RNA-binding protein [Candidatus Pacearchaeota archaeon]|nr:RNA-binding protein [Candidatus Pacearchaeota archaeon]
MKKSIKEEQEENSEFNREPSDSESVKRVVVVPGETIVSGEDYLPGEGTRRINEDVVASRYGLAEIAGRVIKVISLFGAFIPRRGNVVIGRVSDITFRGWNVDIDSASAGFLPIEESPRFINKDEMDQFLAIGEVVAAKIWNVNARGIDLSFKGKGLGKLEGGFIFRVIPSRVPRIIGREGSMVNLIKDKTGCNVTIGQNGWIWIRGSSISEEIRARKAIEYVAEQVFIDGLTEKMEEWFDKNK